MRLCSWNISPSHCIPLGPFPGNFVVPKEEENHVKRTVHLCNCVFLTIGFVLTFVCLIYKYARCQGLGDHLDLGHKAVSIWIIKLLKQRHIRK